MESVSLISSNISPLHNNLKKKIKEEKIISNYTTKSNLITNSYTKRKKTIHFNEKE